MKKIFYLISCFIFISTSCSNKVLYDLQKESLDTHVVVDSLVNGLRFGMSEEQVYDIIGWSDVFYNGQLDIDGLRSYELNVYPSFFNDSLYAVSFSSQMSEHLDWSFENIVCKLKNMYGVYSYSDKDYYETVRVWLKGNLQIRLRKIQSDIWPVIAIEYIDLRKTPDFRNIADSSLVRTASRFENGGGVYFPSDDLCTKEYLKREPVKDLNLLAKLEKASLAENKKHHYILGKIPFNAAVKEFEIDRLLEVGKDDSRYVFDSRSLKRCRFNVAPFFLNDTICKLVFTATSGGDFGDHNLFYYPNIIKDFSAIHGKPAIHNRDCTIWLDGNLKVQISKSRLFDGEILRIEYSDLLRCINEIDIISGRVRKTRNRFETEKYSKENIVMDV